MCKHISQLGDKYPGRFCLYCGEELGSLSHEAGQLLFTPQDGSQKKRYLAVIHERQQKIVTNVNDSADRASLTLNFADGREVTVESRTLTLAWQESSRPGANLAEALIIK
jgi:hypothetical protein